MKFSFIVFLPIHPIPATRPVIVAASRIDFTSLLSEIVLCIFKILNYSSSILSSYSSIVSHIEYKTQQRLLIK